MLIGASLSVLMFFDVLSNNTWTCDDKIV
jgi:hypothetical protein